MLIYFDVEVSIHQSPVPPDISSTMSLLGLSAVAAHTLSFDIIAA
jgi:hypothetical protein